MRAVGPVVSMEDNTSTDEIEEREVIQIAIPLDPAHSRIDAVLRNEGLNVTEAISQQVTPVAEKALHDLLQQEKYENQ